MYAGLRVYCDRWEHVSCSSKFGGRFLCRGRILALIFLRFVKSHGLNWYYRMISANVGKKTPRSSHLSSSFTAGYLVCYTAVFRVVTQRSSPQKRAMYDFSIFKVMTVSINTYTSLCDIFIFRVADLSQADFVKSTAYLIHCCHWPTNWAIFQSLRCQIP